ncbi:MAG: quinone-dependent dihydroorotate dehydrogenase [Saprospiraceae bacterium]|nr:quinone-dependent dihydroorotate dehydrogenase [Saprospiraceae bacterium]
MYQLLKFFLFLLPPERAHRFTVRMLDFVRKVPILNQIIIGSWKLESPVLRKQLMDLSFPNPIGLAAGFDKDGKYIDIMASLGFGFIEVGTVTPLPQVGNPQPRLFRLPKDQALINRMGFNNDGVDALVSRLVQKRSDGLIVGGNIGKNKDTPIGDAITDYEISFQKLFPYVDYFVVNVSSPNTPGLRQLQDREPLTKLLERLQFLNGLHQQTKPIMLKIAPDLTDYQLEEIVEIVQEQDLAGIIATNTTIDRSNLTSPEGEIEKIGPGGLSGLPLKSRSTEIIRMIRKIAGPDLVIIGVGGIMEKSDAIEKLEAGADLIQLYSGLIYKGPSLIKQIKRLLIQKAS